MTDKKQIKKIKLIRDLFIGNPVNPNELDEHSIHYLPVNIKHEKTQNNSRGVDSSD